MFIIITWTSYLNKTSYHVPKLSNRNLLVFVVVNWRKTLKACSDLDLDPIMPNIELVQPFSHILQDIQMSCSWINYFSSYCAHGHKTDSNEYLDAFENLQVKIQKQEN